MAVPFLTQIGALIWLLATMRQQHISTGQQHISTLSSIERVDRHTQEHCTELREVNVRLVRLETQIALHDDAGRDWREDVDKRFGRMEDRLERLEAGDDE